MYNEKAMKGRYYLEITFGDNNDWCEDDNNDWCEAMKLILPAIKMNIANFDGCIDYFADDIYEFFESIRNLIIAQLNLLCWVYQVRYNYAENASQIKFSAVPEDKIKTADNLKTAYLQLFGSPKDIGNFFIV